MNVRGVTYRSFYHGQVGIDIELGAGEAPFSFRPVELHKFVLHLRKIQPVHIVNVNHASGGYLEEDKEQIVTLAQTLKEIGVPTWSEGDGNSFPPWLPLVSARLVHISSQPWYQYAVNEIIYHMDEALEPQVDAHHIQAGVSLYVLVHSKAEVERAVRFISKDRRPWKVMIPRRFEVFADLTDLDIPKLSEEL